MANWMRMNGVTTASGPSFSAPLATKNMTTQASPTWEGTLRQAVGVRMGMPEPPVVPQSPYSPCGGPSTGGGLAGLPVPRMIPPSQRPTQVNRGLARMAAAYALLAEIAATWGTPGPDELVFAQSVSDTCEVDSDELCNVLTEPLESDPALDPGLGSEGPAPPGNCCGDGAPCDPTIGK
jgi:hypothetical protein